MIKKELWQLLENGIAADILEAEQAFFLFKSIGNYASAINTSKKNYRSFFSTIQRHAQNSFILATARIFDPPSKKFPTRCLLGLVAKLEQHSRDLPQIIERDQMKENMMHAGMPHESCLLLDSDAPDCDVTMAIVKYARDRINSVEIQAALTEVKNVRDKRIAHNEAVNELSGPTWEAIQSMLSLAQDIVGIVGIGYLSVCYKINGKYILTEDAMIPSRACIRLLKEVT